MNYKKKSIILSIFVITSILTLLLINNRQKTSIRYFIWNTQDVSIGRVICISFISGLLISSILNKTYNNNVIANKEMDDDEKSDNNDNLINLNDNESYEIPPERDLRDTQPTISVNYRVIKDNVENESKDRNQTSKKSKFHDDWNNDDSEW